MDIDRRRLLALAAAGAAPVAGCEAIEARAAFLHGVASGDPAPDRITLWTRATPHGRPRRVEVAWEIAEDPAFARMVDQGVVSTGPDRDYTVKVDVGGLAPGRDHHYRFRVGEAVSPVGRTRTLQRGRAAMARLAVASCALYPAGRFNAYRHMAEGTPLDAVVHLGDYIYEYGGGAGDYGAAGAAERGRALRPAHEVVTLADYRARHALYKSDPDLQAAHAAAPWICVWDDHDVANDAWMDGAQNHQPETEGTWAARKSAALQAWYEWMPMREPAPGQAREAIFRAFDFGDVATLAMLETRLTARARQLSPGDPNLEAALEAPRQRMMSGEQADWLEGVLTASAAAGKAWQVIGSEILMASVAWPDLGQALGETGMAALPERSRAAARRYAAQVEEAGGRSYDAWDGYPADRRRVYAGVVESRANMIAVSGDTHAFWVNTLNEGGRRVGVEFGTASVTSPSRNDDFPEVDLGGLLQASNPDVVFADQRSKGYLRLTLTRRHAVAEMIETGVDRPFAARTVARYRLSKGGELQRLV